MAPQRDQYKKTLESAATNTNDQPSHRKKKTPTYQTLRRWRLKGKLNVENLEKHGINIKFRTPAPAAEQENQQLSAANTSTSNVQPSTSASVEQCSSSGTMDATSVAFDRISNVNTGSFSDYSNSSFSCDTSLSISEANLSSSDDEKSDGSDSARLGVILQSQSIGPDALNELLHPNLSVTKFETLLMIMHLSMKHGMSGVFMDDLLTFVEKLIGVPNALVSKHLLQKLFLFGSKPTVHFYCPNCMIYLGSEASYSNGSVECDGCDWISTVSSHNGEYYFLSLSLREQIRDVITRPNVKFVSKDRLEHVMSDMMDGIMYKVLSKEGNILANPDAFTLTVNTDGSPVFESGPNSLWPVHFFVNEIDPSQRFDVDNMLLGGLWFGKSEANTQIFLKPFVEELKELERHGVVWRKPDGTVVESPVYAVCCCCDSVARPKVQQLHQFNGAFGCGMCLHPNVSFTVLEKIESRSGIVLGNNPMECDNNDPQIAFRRKKVMRYLRGDYELRTNKDLRKHMKLAASTDVYDHVMGATGISVFCDLKYFNVVYGFVLDYMHNILLGNLKRLAGHWFDTTNNGSPYYIGLSVGRVDSRLQDITLPKGFRPPRPMSDRTHWHANEWRAFLLYYGLPVLVNILPNPYYNHFKKLVKAIYTLTKDRILDDEVDDAHEVLNDFVSEYQDLYGEINMVYNVHITSHLALVVSKMGPLWAYSAFPFESANGRLVKLVKGTKGVCTQISRKYLMTKNIPNLLRKNYNVRDEILDFCCNVIGYRYLKNSSKCENGETMLGRQYYYSLNDAQKQAFIDKNVPVQQTVLIANRIVVKGQIFHSRLTTRQIKACDSCIRLSSGEFALIDLIIRNFHPNDSFTDVAFLVTKLNIATDPSPFMVSHIKQCSLDAFGEQELIRSEDISRKCIFYSCTDRNFVAEISNFFETD